MTSQFEWYLQLSDKSRNFTIPCLRSLPPLPDITKIRLMISTGIKPVDTSKDSKDSKDSKYGVVQNSWQTFRG